MVQRPRNVSYRAQCSDLPCIYRRDGGVSWQTGFHFSVRTRREAGRWSAKLMFLAETLSQVEVKDFFFFSKAAHLEALDTGY